MIAAGNQAGPAARGVNVLLAWGSALFLSLLAHGMLLAVLETATAPDPVPFTETVPQGIDLSSLEVPNERATAQTAEGETAAEAEAGGERLGVEAVPTSRAAPLAATGQALAAAAPQGAIAESVSPRGPATAALAAPSAPLAAAETGGDPAQALNLPREAMPPVEPAGEAVAAREATSQSLAAATADAPVLAVAEPVGTAVLAKSGEATALAATTAAVPLREPARLPSATLPAAAAPAETISGGEVQGTAIALNSGAGTKIAAAAGSGEALPASSGSGATIAATAAPAAALPPADPGATALTMDAALAWSGGAGTQLDEKSLATIQSFMNTGAVSESASFAGTPRDQIGATLAQVPCSRLQAAFQPETGGLEVRGHVPAEDLRAGVVALLTQTVGGAIPIGGSILVLPEPQCGLLSAVENLGFPQSTDQEGDPLVIGREAQAAILEMEDKQLVSFQLQAPEFDAFVYLDYYDKDGKVVHVLPNEFDAENRWLADQPFKVGGTVEEGAKFQMQVAPPFGQDIAVVLGASHALYDGTRPLVEDAAGYLAWLKERIEALQDEAPGFRGEWAYLFVKTGPQGAFTGQ